MTRRAIRAAMAAAAICAGMGPVAGAAQNLGNEDPVPETYFREVFIGRYAAPGRCGTDDIEDLLVISEVGVQIGDVLCEGVGKMTWIDGWMRVPLYTCRIDQRDWGDRVLHLRRETGGDISVRSSVDEPRVPNEVMQRCGP
jgi:hypothetical protein